MAMKMKMGKLAQKDGVIKGILLHQGESNPNDRDWPIKAKVSLLSASALNQFRFAIDTEQFGKDIEFSETGA